MNRKIGLVFSMIGVVAAILLFAASPIMASQAWPDSPSIPGTPGVCYQNGVQVSCAGGGGMDWNHFIQFW